MPIYDDYTEASEQEKFEKLNELFIRALAFAEDSKIDWTQTLTMATYHLSEFSLWQTRGDLAGVSCIMLYTLEMSGMKRVTIEQLDDMAKHISISINASPKIQGQETKAAMILLAATQRSIEELILGREGLNRRLH